MPFPEPPTVVNGLKVVVDKLPKLRLKYEPLDCNRLQDLFGAGDFMTTSDDKSGYCCTQTCGSTWALRTRASTIASKFCPLAFLDLH